ncbi:MAG: hypothetical protein U0T11_03245 [Chitinophagaceae bacterium]
MHLYTFLLSIVTTVKNSGSALLPFLSIASVVTAGGLLSRRSSRKNVRTFLKQHLRRSRSIGSRILTILLVAGSILLFLTLLSKSTAAALIFILVLVIVMSVLLGLKS